MRDNKPEPNWFLSLRERYGFQWTPRQRLEWLLDFVQRGDLSTLKGPALNIATGQFAYFIGATQEFLDSSPALSGVDLESFAAFVRDGLNKLQDSEKPQLWDIPLHEAEDVVRRVRRVDPRTREVFIHFFTTDKQIAGRLSAQEIIAKNFPNNIRRCPECGRFFFVNKRQAYCSPHCSQAARTRKWRAEPKNRAKVNQLRREYYRRQVAKKQGRDASDIRIQKRARP